jgi:transposase-like protein
VGSCLGVIGFSHTILALGFANASPYQRTPERRDQRNGNYERDLGTPMGVIKDLAVPRIRNGFRTKLFERYQRRQEQLDQAILEMFVGGVSTAKVGEVFETLSGANLSPSTVFPYFHSLDEEFESWKGSKLQSYYLLLRKTIDIACNRNFCLAHSISLNKKTARELFAGCSL